VWGFHWVVVKVGLEYFPPLTYGALRLLTGLLTMVLIVGSRRRLRRPPRADVPVILSVGLFQIAASVLIMNFALQAVPAGRSSVLQYSMPLWVAVIMWAVFRTAPRRHQLVGLVLGLSGILVLVNPSVIDWGIPLEVAGTLALTVSAMLWAAVTIHVKRHRWISKPLDLQPWTLAVASVPIVLAALLLERGATVSWEPVALLVLAYSGPLATAFAFWASQAITRSLGPLDAAVGFLAAPVVGLLAGAIVLNESLGLLDIAGFALVLGGIAITSVFDALAASRERANAEAVPGPSSAT
jgi:drug/metabolite transporter (DMT)-like permease